MWQDYIGIIPGIAAVAMGVVTMATAPLTRWQKLLIVTFSVIAIGATGLSQWWIIHEKKAEAERRSEILEHLGSFIADGQTLMSVIYSAPTEAVPTKRVAAWETETTSFLSTLGNSYVVRFNSDAGLPYVNLIGADDEHSNLWLAVRNHVIRLNEFSSEFSGK